MKKYFAVLLVLFLFVIACGSKNRPPSSLVAPPPDPTSRLSKKDKYQAEQWLKTAQMLEMTGEYTSSWEYCQNIISYYPGTIYSEEAQMLGKKISDPAKNRRKEFYRNNPALFLGY